MHGLRIIKGIPDFVLDDYAEETLGVTADAEAICFTRILFKTSGHSHIGVGMGNNIDQAAARAVLSGINALLKIEKIQL